MSAVVTRSTIGSPRNADSILSLCNSEIWISVKQNGLKDVVAELKCVEQNIHMNQFVNNIDT